MEVIKSKLMVDTACRHKVEENTRRGWSWKTNPTLALSRSILQTEGWMGFMKGYWISLGVFAPYSFLYVLDEFL